jgi:hypothetical protein
MTTSCRFWVGPTWGDGDLFLVGICEAGVCVGGCDPDSKKPTPCPVPEHEDWACCPGWSGCEYTYVGCPAPPVTDCTGAYDWMFCRVEDSLGVCVDGDCLVLDCSGFEDGTECLIDLPGHSGPGLCEAGSCEQQSGGTGGNGGTGGTGNAGGG